MNRFTLLKSRNLSKWIGFVFAFAIFGVTIWFTTQFVNQLKSEEKMKIENYAEAVQILGSDEDLNSQIQNYLTGIISANKTMPVVLLDESGEIMNMSNIPEDIQNKPHKLNKIVQKMKDLHDPIEVDLGVFGKQYVYYENSQLLKRLQYYPIILILIIILFVYFSYWYFRTLKNTEQSFLWAGMAKETAHQIGTPLSSLLGWIEILKMEKVDQEPVLEMEKDIQRLNQITERFSKIGSIPELRPSNVVEITENTVHYLRNRISKKVDIQFVCEKGEIRIPLNTALYSWVLENLIKNAVDAMQNIGAINVYINDGENKVSISVVDTGPGIPKKMHKQIFDPGYTTKQRGWGLGLSLAKRIIENYHKGHIFVAKSDRNSGTEIRIILRKA
ncbi:MAG: HAMP domain-containing sensor histidine kinase [Weeksellaceae bacterium]|jgi:C4-dicarboxylate-specific signal transduction histidine kinase|nr:HAMP domain-containing sensor histidine kinase [Weeksellaceae bacterium]MDX9705855.1 HAMP domain-containing sensor histidine kinase [Weeksellaceae bacterium]